MAICLEKSKMQKPKRHGRKRPYTTIGVRRLPCARCGQPASRQWQICADDNLWRPICKWCDVIVNGRVLRAMHDPDWVVKINRYREKMFG